MQLAPTWWSIRNQRRTQIMVGQVIVQALLDLVQQDDRVGGLGGIDGADDAAGHCADVCTAVAADLGFIMHAAKAHAGIVAAHAGGKGARIGGFADPRRLRPGR